MTHAGRARIIWFADLEALDEDLGVLEVLRDEAGLTTVAPESHISHTSGFRAPADIIERSPFEDWRDRPGLREHRSIFGTREPAMAALPGIVGGVDDAPLLRVLEACSRLGLEVWGHAGMWCYGAELYPERAAVDLFGRSMLPASLPWGTMFCPSQDDLNGWMADALADATVRYDLDGWFLDHGRHPAPGFAAGILACGCERCAATASELGVDLDRCRADLRELLGVVSRMRGSDATTLSGLGPTGLHALLLRFPGVLDWLDVRAAILARRFSELGRALKAAARRPIGYGSDVFPPSVALLGGQDYAAWAEEATYLTGGFGARIGWGSVGRVTSASLGDALASLAPDLDPQRARAVVARLIGAAADGPGIDETADGQGAVDQASVDAAAARTEVARMGAVRPAGAAVYPPLPGSLGPAALEMACTAIVEAGLDGAMLAGLETSTSETRAIVRTRLSERL